MTFHPCSSCGELNPIEDVTCWNCHARVAPAAPKARARRTGIRHLLDRNKTQSNVMGAREDQLCPSCGAPTGAEAMICRTCHYVPLKRVPREGEGMSLFKRIVSGNLVRKPEPQPPGWHFCEEEIGKGQRCRCCGERNVTGAVVCWACHRPVPGSFRQRLKYKSAFLLRSILGKVRRPAADDESDILTIIQIRQD